jgi:hypothetical protein
VFDFMIFDDADYDTVENVMEVYSFLSGRFADNESTVPTRGTAFTGNQRRYL